MEKSVFVHHIYCSYLTQSVCLVQKFLPAICYYEYSIYRVTTCLENLEISGNLTAVREMSGILLKVREMSGEKSCQGKVA